MLNPFTHRKILRKGKAGHALVTAIGTPARGATTFNLPMTLQVYVEGLAPYEVKDQWWVKARDYGALTGSIPVKIDPQQQMKVAIDWETLRSEFQRACEAQQQALAMQGIVTDPVEAAERSLAFGTATAHAANWVLDMRNDSELRAKIERLLGRKLTPGTTERVAENDPVLQRQIMRVVQEHMSQKVGEGAEKLTQLERLAALRDGGALTEEEFQAEKRKLLSQ